MQLDWENIVSFSYDGIYVADGQGRTIYVSPGCERNYEVPAGHLLGRNVADIEKEGIFTPSVVLQVIRAKRRITLIQDTGCGKRLMATGNPIFGTDGKLNLVVCNSRDITELLNLKEQLKEVAEQADRYRSELLELRQMTTQIPGLVTKSPAMSRILELIQKVSRVDSNLVIEGESGTGKTLAAKTIHRLSLRKDGPFISVNCGAIPETLLESELFGYEGGAFTGAMKGGKAGFFELADGGTLFLDEIGELPVSLQVKLLQALQDKTCTRIGGRKPIPVDFRLVAATNRNLEEMVQNRTFREDLYYRLNVILIHLPPLCERLEDIPELATQFLNQYNQLYDKNVRLTLEAMHTLMHYPWPGNVRQLQNTIEKIVVLSDKEQITDNDLKYVLSTPLDVVHSDTPLTLPYDVKAAVAHLERKYIREAMRKTNSTRKTATLLNLSQSTVVRRLKEIQFDSFES